MIRVETSGLFHYEVLGEKEEAAAKELENLYWNRWMRIGFPMEDDMIEAIEKIGEKFGCRIKWVVG